MATPRRLAVTTQAGVLLTAGQNDTRVEAWHAKNMTAPAPGGGVAGEHHAHGLRESAQRKDQRYQVGGTL